MKNYVNDSAVIQYSIYDAVEMLPDEETKALAYRYLILNALTDEFNLTDNTFVNVILTMARPTQISTKQRYNKAVENGKLGGRPQKVDRKIVFELRKNGYTQNQIAKELGCTERTVRNILKAEITGNNLEVEVEDEVEDEIEVEVEDKVEITQPQPFTHTSTPTEETSSTTSATSTSGATLSSKEERLFTGDVIYNLIRLFGKEKYYDENKAKYLKWVDKVFPNISKKPSSLELLTCALISLKARNFNIERTSDNDSFNYWVIDALNHVKKNNILVRYKDKILHQKSDERLHFLELERKQTEVKEDTKEENYDDEEDCELPF